MVVAPKPAFPGMRELRDPRDMRALAHPTRLALMEVLTVHGPMTATQAADLIGESPSSCSFHLRTLARHGFVEEAGPTVGRQRPWRVSATGMHLGEYEDRGTELAATELKNMFLERQLVRMRQAFATRTTLPGPWRTATTMSEAVLWVTAEEAVELNETVLALLARYQDRMADPAPRPAGSRPTEFLWAAYVTDFDRPQDQSAPSPGVGPVGPVGTVGPGSTGPTGKLGKKARAKAGASKGAADGSGKKAPKPVGGSAAR